MNKYLQDALDDMTSRITWKRIFQMRFTDCADFQELTEAERVEVSKALKQLGEDLAVFVEHWEPVELSPVEKELQRIHTTESLQD